MNHNADLIYHLCRYIQLENGVRLMLASNPKATTSATALDIKIGSFSDPLHLQGLAHLCEHVLFTGSEGFPNESYSQFLGKEDIKEPTNPKVGLSALCISCNFKEERCLFDAQMI